MESVVDGTTVEYAYDSSSAVAVLLRRRAQWALG